MTDFIKNIMKISKNRPTCTKIKITNKSKYTIKLNKTTIGKDLINELPNIKFINSAKLIYSDRFEYKIHKNRYRIYCKIHGEVYSNQEDHLKKNGNCYNCNNILRHYVINDDGSITI